MTASEASQATGSDEQMNRIAVEKLFVQLTHQLQDLGCDRHVQGLGDIVRDEQRRVRDQRVDYHHPLHHAAGVLERILVEPTIGGGDLHRLQEANRLVAGFLAGDVRAHRAELLDQLSADRHRRVERPGGVAADIGDLAARQGARIGRIGYQIASLKQHLPLGDFQGRGEPADQGPGQHRLARAALADHRKDAPGRDVERDVAQDRASVRHDRQVAYRKNRLAVLNVERHVRSPRRPCCAPVPTLRPSD